jgi:hypothetical protein
MEGALRGSWTVVDTNTNHRGLVMDGTTLREVFQQFVPRELIERFAKRIGVVGRDRKRDVVTQVWSLALSGGSDDSGRLADAFVTYLQEADQEVVRGSYYGWFTDKFALTMCALVHHALANVRKLPPHLPGKLAGVEDWILVDSETITLPNADPAVFPSTSKRAGIKIHKYFSVGRNNMVNFRLSPAREHDAPHLRVDERLRGHGLVVDLAYVSCKLLQKCKDLDISLVVRLKDGWNPKLLGVADADGVVTAVDDGLDLDGILASRPDSFDGQPVDLDVRCGSGKNAVEVRLVGVPGEGKYHFCLTTLGRSTHTPEDVASLYRMRWEIECDMKRNKAAGRIDQIYASTPASIFALLFGAMLHTIVANHLVYLDLMTRPARRAPLHGLALGLAMQSLSSTLHLVLHEDTPERWEKVARALRMRAEDPNWRGRPSVLDELRGTKAPPGRARRAKLKDSPLESAPYRRLVQAA